MPVVTQTSRSAEMDEWLHKIEDHCENVGYQRVVINKLNLAECIVDALEDARKSKGEDENEN